MTLSTLRYMGFLPGDPGYLTGHNPRQITSKSCDECGAQVSLTGVTRGLATCTETECNSTEAKLRREVADLRHLLSVATEVARERAATITRMRPVVDAALPLTDVAGPRRNTMWTDQPLTLIESNSGAAWQAKIALQDAVEKYREGSDD